LIARHGEDLTMINTQMANSPHYFTYKFDDGPLSLSELSKGKFTTGNCRRAIQDYLYVVFGRYLTPEQVLLPEGYLLVGVVITTSESLDLSKCKPGDIIYAERLKDKFNNPVNKSRKCFHTEGEWLVSLHSALFVSQKSIYHATAISGESCYWGIEKFQQYYKIIAIKRVLV